MAKKKSSRSRVFLVIGVLLVASGAALFAIQNYNDNKEREMFMSLREDMKALQVEFNKIDDGWQYKEGCNGQGGVYQRDEPAFCTVSIVNEQADATKLKSRYEEYSRRTMGTFINSTPLSTTPWKDDAETNTRLHKSAGYTNKESPEIKCVLREFYSTDESSSSAGGIGFSCVKSATKFYFPRYDL